MDETKLGRPIGMFHIKHIRKGEVINEFDAQNGVTDGGYDKLLDVMFGAVTPITAWYVGLIMDGGYSALADADTMSSHAGWAEFTNYDEATRPQWTVGAASGQAISNATAMTFTMSGGDTLKGLFCCSSATKSGTSGTLWSTALFSSDYAVETDDELNITYQVSA